jgi:hypothetical protein
MIAYCAKLLPSPVVFVFIVVEREIQYTVRDDAQTISTVVLLGRPPLPSAGIGRL